MNNVFSILIPVYNFDISTLVEELYKQANLISDNFEILLIDDCSSKEYTSINKNFQFNNKVTFKFLEENIGRSKIRNLLFQEAKYENCLILDCDVKIISKDFLLNYFNSLNNNVVVGGHQYSKVKPNNKSLYFHWLYGSKVEVQNIKKRLKNPYSSFMTNSFATTKTIFNKIKFNEKLTKYGHEDTLFGIALRTHKIPIIHIDKPVLHVGLDSELDFIKKQEKAIQNLCFLYEKNDVKKNLENIKLIIFYNSYLNKYPFIIFIFIIKGLLKGISFLKIDKLELLKFNLWKIEKFNYYYQGNIKD